MTFIARYKIPLLLFLLGIAVFSSTIKAEKLFSWDDNRYLEENERVRNFQLVKIFTSPYFGGYMPITLFSFALEHKLWGLNPTGYHTVNMILHALNGALVFFFLFLLTGRRSASLLGAVLFIIHPVQTETVAWISERKNLLSMLFFLLAFISHIQCRQRDALERPYLAWCFYLLAVLSKPIVVGAPLLIMAYDYFWAKRSAKQTILGAIPWLGIATFGAITILITSATVGGIKTYWGGSHWSALQLTFLTVWDYLVSLLNPSTLSPHYLYLDEVIQGNWRVWAGLILLLGFVGMALSSLRRFFRDAKTNAPMMFFIVLWVVAFMLPVSNIVPLSIQRADRFLYFPSVLIFFGVGSLFERIWRRYPEGHARYVLVGVVVAGAVLLASATYRFSQVWNNAGTLWTYQLTKFPRDDIAVSNLAMYYFRTKQYPMAMQVYGELARMVPDSFRPPLFLGLIADEQKRYGDAIRHLRQAIPLADAKLAEDIKSQLISVYIKAITQARNEGRQRDAVDYHYEVIELMPDNHSVYNDLGNAYREMGNLEAAAAAYKQAMALSPAYYAAAHANLGHARLLQGQIDEAQAIFMDSLGKQPSAIAASGQCKALIAKGDATKAQEACYLAVALSPDEVQYADQLVQTLLRYYTPEEALAAANKRLAKYPDMLYPVLGDIYAKSGQPKAAIDQYQKSNAILSQLRLGEAALSAKEYAQADAAFQRVLDNSAEKIEAIGGRCLALAHLRNWKDAASFCQTAVEGRPDQARYLLAYADLLSAGGRSNEAIELYQKALDKGATEAAPTLAAAYFQLGVTAESSGLTGDAIMLFRRAIALNAKEKNYHLHLGQMLLKQRRYADALAASEAAIALDAQSAMAYAAKGTAAHGLGEIDTARAAFEQALAIDASSPQVLKGFCAFLRATGGDAEPVCRQVQPASP